MTGRTFPRLYVIAGKRSVRHQPYLRLGASSLASAMKAEKADEPELTESAVRPGTLGVGYLLSLAFALGDENPLPFV